MEEVRGRSWFQFSLRTMMVFILGFAVGFSLRNVASGLHPLALWETSPFSNVVVTTGDVLRFDSSTERSLVLDVAVQPDGTIVLPLLGAVPVEGMSVAEIEEVVSERYEFYYKQPGIKISLPMD